MENTLEEVKAILNKYNQEHLLNHFSDLDEKKQKMLLEQILNIDFELINSLYANIKKEDTENNDKIEPIEYLDKNKLYDDYKYYENIGKHAIESGKLAAVTMAGGQGTRLGHNGPKGTLMIDKINPPKSIFEIFSDNKWCKSCFSRLFR